MNIRSKLTSRAARRMLLPIAALMALIGAIPAQAETITEYPNWRLEQYTNGGIGVWNTSASCGKIEFDASVSTTVIDRFWSMVLTAKATHRPMGVYLNVANGHCVIASFYMDG